MERTREGVTQLTVKNGHIEGQNLLVESSVDLPRAADDDRQHPPDKEEHAVGRGCESKLTESRQEQQSESELHELTVKTIQQMGLADQLVSLLSQSMTEEHRKQPKIQSLIRGLMNTAVKPPATGQWVGNAWINCMEIEESEDAPVMVGEQEQWPEVEFEVALDSGSVVHVCSQTDTLGYLLEPSPGSKRDQKFLMGDGGRLPNQGQKHLKLFDGTSGSEISSTFQIAAVTRPLMSVGKICDEGMSVVFEKNHARVLDKTGREVCRFERQPGGLYVARLKLRSPGFVGQ